MSIPISLHFLLREPPGSKKNRTNPLSGFTDDSDTVPEAQRKTAQQKVALLNITLGQRANFCPVIHAILLSKAQLLLTKLGKPFSCILVFIHQVHISLISLTFALTIMNDPRIYFNEFNLSVKTIYKLKTVP